MVHPLLLDALQPLFVAPERGLDRREQLLELGLARLVGLAEALAGLVEEILVCLFEQLVADLAELGDQGVAAVGQVFHPLVEGPGVGLERGEIARGVAVGVALVADLVELEPQRFDRGPSLLAPAAAPQPADQRSDRQRRQPG
jgi:hypothetical protein